MALVEIKTNFRVEVEPRGLGDFGSVRMSDGLIEPNLARRAKRYEDACKEMVEDIRRHVDGAGYVTIKSDTEYGCTHCGHYTEDKSEGCLCPDEEPRAALAKAKGGEG